MPDEDEVEETRAPRRPAHWAWGAYRHIAAVLGAFTMAILVHELFGLGWHGILGRLVNIWSDVVRPATTWVIDVFAWPIRQLFPDFDVLQPARDYLSVGFIMALSMVRADVRGLRSHNIGRHKSLRENVEGALWLFFLSVMVIISWTIMVVISLIVIVRTSSKLFRVMSTEDREMVVMVLPLIYLGVLCVVNLFLR